MSYRETSDTMARPTLPSLPSYNKENDDDQDRKKQPYQQVALRSPQPPILPPHVHKPVDFTHDLKAQGHSIEALTAELRFVLNLRGESGNRLMTKYQRATLGEYHAKRGVYARLLNPEYSDDNLAYFYGHLFNVLILQDKLKGMIGFVFDRTINEEKPAETTIEKGNYATIKIWSQAFITRRARRIRQLQQIVLVEQLNAFFRLYGCTRCWMQCPCWQDEGLYGKTDLYHTINKAITDNKFLALSKFRKDDPDY